MRKVLTTLCLLTAGLWPGLAQGQPVARIAVDQEFPVRGETSTVTVTGEGGEPVGSRVVEVTYRPNSETSSTEELPATDAAGQVAWTPRDAGIVTLAVGDEASHNVAVRFGSFPGSGLAIMILAGLLLFGGAGLGFLVLLRSPDAAEEAPEPPST